MEGADVGDIDGADEGATVGAADGCSVVGANDGAVDEHLMDLRRSTRERLDKKH